MLEVVLVLEVVVVVLDDEVVVVGLTGFPLPVGGAANAGMPIAMENIAGSMSTRASERMVRAWRDTVPTLTLNRARSGWMKSKPYTFWQAKCGES